MAQGETTGVVSSRRQVIVGAAVTLGALAAKPFDGLVNADEITRSSAAIHHRVVFNASSKRVYDALTEAAQFDKVTRLSAAMRAGIPIAANPTVISRTAGGSFTLFGGFITGRHIELVPATRIVQAWRDSGWKPGVFSLVKFELAPQDNGTVLTFEHTGFPDANADHLNAGWHANYWEPLTKFLA